MWLQAASDACKAMPAAEMSVCHPSSNCHALRRLTAGSKPVHIGYFDSQETAARAYDQESLKLRGPNSNLNFPMSSYTVRQAEVPPRRGLHETYISS